MFKMTTELSLFWSRWLLAPTVGVMLFAASVVARFLPDTGVSMWARSWQNAILILMIALLFAVPLAATCQAYHASRPAIDAAEGGLSGRLRHV
jgi:hypothetical protein